MEPPVLRGPRQTPRPGEPRGDRDLDSQAQPSGSRGRGPLGPEQCLRLLRGKLATPAPRGPAPRVLTSSRASGAGPAPTSARLSPRIGGFRAGLLVSLARAEGRLPAVLPSHPFQPCSYPGPFSAARDRHGGLKLLAEILGWLACCSLSPSTRPLIFSGPASLEVLYISMALFRSQR